MSHHPKLVTTAQGQRPFFLGVDIGGTNIKLGMVDDLGQVLGRTSVPTLVPDGPDAGVARLANAARQLLHELRLTLSDVAAIGLGAPGTMDIPAGMFLEPFNLPGWFHYPIRDRVQAALGRPVSFANDANAAAFGEAWIGSGQRFNSIVMLTLGTGVGGGIILGDLSVDGENSCGSECGHIIIDYHETARLCGCGKRGHLEAYASATALVKRAEEALAAGRSSTVTSRIKSGEALTPLLLAAAAEAGDPLALELILDTAKYIGIASTSLIHAIDPGAVILGGAMNFGGHTTSLGRQFLERVRQEIRLRCFPVPAQRVTIDFATLAGDAGYIGAAGIARATRRKGTQA